MARRLRIEFEGATYHVTSRGNRRKMVLGDEDLWRWLERLRRAAEAVVATYDISADRLARRP